MKIKNKKINKNKSKNSTQDFFEIKTIYQNGIIENNRNELIKIIEITPISFNLKIDIEKEAILNNYKIFLMTCDFDMQIIIKTEKQNIENYVNDIYSNLNQENNNIKFYSEKYIEFLRKLCSEKKISQKKYYIVIRSKPIKENEREETIQELNEKFYLIKELLIRCGNSCNEIKKKNKIIDIFKSYFDRR